MSHALRCRRCGQTWDVCRFVDCPAPDDHFRGVCRDCLAREAARFGDATVVDALDLAGER